jgi:ketosteroid isomerase-like protein
MEQSQSVYQDILRVQERFWAALRTRDAAMLTSVLAPTFVGRSPGEANQTRDAFVATLLAFPASISGISGEDIEVHFFGEVAILTGVQVARLQFPAGQAKSSRVMLSNVFCQDDRDWRMVLSYAFELLHDL